MFTYICVTEILELQREALVVSFQGIHQITARGVVVLLVLQKSCCSKPPHMLQIPVWQKHGPANILVLALQHTVMSALGVTHKFKRYKGDSVLSVRINRTARQLKVLKL